MTLLFLFAAIVVTLFCTYQRLSLTASGLMFSGVAVVKLLLTGFSLLSFLFIGVAILLLLLAQTSLREQFLSRCIFHWFCRVLPEISQTEQEAIDAGTVWWEGELFSGEPDWDQLLSMPKPTLTEDEQAFLDGPVQVLCRMTNKWEINHNLAVIPQEIEQYIKDEGFLGMIIPKAYGGLGFSGVAQSEVLSRVSICGGGIGIFIGVPNSLGPGELLLKYGTEEQKNYYLPRLARGIDVPCFALTGPLAGSDATSLPDTGVVCRGEFNGEEMLGIRLNFEKRYITLAPFASIIGLAFQLYDPDHLMGDKDQYGITCALIPRNTKGIRIGRRHKPIGDAFINGPIFGKDVFIPLDYIIGGAKMAGKGWTMLVNCLSVGRCVTLPSSSNGVAKQMLLGTASYSALREQFGLPLAKFEGVQKPLARIAGFSYIINAACLHTIQSLAFGEKPSVASAILKYYSTEMARQCAIDAMDIQGGKAVMTGPKNYVADAYMSIPVMITVEGANIMTRNLMIFGQGATRGHPYILKEMQLAGQPVNDEILAEFDKAFFGHIGFSLSNLARSFIVGLTGGCFSEIQRGPKLAQHYRDINRLSTAFAVVADISMLVLQSSLKFKEMLSARLGDLLSHLYLASMVLKHYESEGCPEEDYPLVEWSMKYLTHQYQIAMQEILQNYPNRFLALTLRWLMFPWGARFNPPEDALDTQVSRLFTEDTVSRRRHLASVFIENIPTNPLGQINDVFMQKVELQPLFDKIKRAIRERKIKKALGAEQIHLALEAEVISKAEAEKLLVFDEALMDIIHVDHFDESQLVRSAPMVQ
ncbi:acyl-CoA dehydrogenase [Candidatus Endobugula sertula]|uniref:Acyl-coenzyme A dehydrogenase n=1 Tax=Candidatus Endobugula sertula TaxID=62101 RepID=A0A1D2QNT6_9GAMM|nr:acyl-CoA dehydrogenase [Candidatus Endobugula sertula]